MDRSWTFGSITKGIDCIGAWFATFLFEGEAARNPLICAWYSSDASTYKKNIKKIIKKKYKPTYIFVWRIYFLFIIKKRKFFWKKENHEIFWYEIIKIFVVKLWNKKRQITNIAKFCFIIKLCFIFLLFVKILDFRTLYWDPRLNTEKKSIPYNRALSAVLLTKSNLSKNY